MTNKRPRYRQLLEFSIVACVTLTMAGCGEPARPTGVAVSGAVTLDGAVLDQGTIHFKPVDLKSLYSTGEIIAGKYAINASVGPQAGKYRIEITSPEGGAKATSADPAKAMELASAPPAKERIPAKYNAQTELTADVPANGNNALNFDLSTK